MSDWGAVLPFLVCRRDLIGLDTFNEPLEELAWGQFQVPHQRLRLLPPACDSAPRR